MAAHREKGQHVVSFLYRRIGFYLVTFWAAITLNFLIPRLMPGDPINALISQLRGNNAQAAVDQLRQRFGLAGHQSLLAQYGSYWSQLAHGDLGISIKYYPTPVTTVIGGGLYWTIGLVGVATVISFLVGTTLGIVTAWRRGSKLDNIVPPMLTFFSAVPYFWIALVVLVVFGVELHWFPLAGGYSQDLIPGWNGEYIGNVLQHATLPAVTIVVSSLAGWFLGMRNMMVTTLAEDVLVAEAKGLKDRRVMFAYAARNAILPNIASFALSLGFIVSGALLTELVFSYPGIGFVLYNAVLAKDLPLMQGVFLIITILVLAANFFADLVYVFLDPRTRQEG
jgi:peptide/nickel transport system permease protein